MAAIAKAKEILASGVKEFLQVKAKTQVRSDASSVVRVLSEVAKKSGSFALAQLASEARDGPFGKVKGLIEAMIDRLTKEAAEEADAKAFCDEEISESRAKQASLTASLDKHESRIAQAEAKKANLQQQIKELQAETAEIDRAQAEATKLRQAEHADYEKASSEYKQSAEAVSNAMQVLQSYYQGAFVQKRVNQAPEFGSAKSDISTQILGMLEVAESDFTRLLSEAETSESEAQSSYDKMTQDNKVSKATKEEDAKGKASEVKSTDVALSNYKEDHEGTSKELDAVLKYLDELKPQCETKVMSYAERKSKREQEIEGLKEALQILEA
jgi:chromosome segregation ATPase